MLRSGFLFGLLVVLGCNDDKGLTATTIVTLTNNTFHTQPPHSDDDGDPETDTGAVTESSTSGGLTTSDAPTTDGPTTAPPATTGTETSSSGTTSDPGGLCGDGKVDPGEECDLQDLNDTTCSDLGHGGGVLLCTLSCTFDTGLCTPAAGCGDGAADPGEECDGSDLNDATCTSFNSPKGTKYTGGILACTPDCAYDESDCTWCGNGKVDDTEQCEGNNLGGFTCTDLGFSSGTLKCSATTCAYDTSSCAGDGAVCGDGACDPNEDSCTCVADCPDDPNSCSPCQCGGSGGSCYCDAQCAQFGDCCADGPC
jgi:hypothetical protein